MEEKKEPYTGVWYGDPEYLKLLDEIPDDRAGEYDSLVHAGWESAADELAERINLKSSVHYHEIPGQYWLKLMNARLIPGAARAVKWAEDHAYNPLSEATDMAYKAEESFDTALCMIGRN